MVRAAAGEKDCGAGEKPGTMAATSAARVANRLAWAHWRRVQRPLKPAGRRRAARCAVERCFAQDVQARAASLADTGFAHE